MAEQICPVAGCPTQLQNGEAGVLAHLQVVHGFTPVRESDGVH